MLESQLSALVTVSERVRGIEPLFKLWKSFVVPINYTRIHSSVHLGKLTELDERDTRIELVSNPWQGLVVPIN